MRRVLVLAFALLGLAGSAASAADLWFHINVDEKGPDGDRVRISLPMRLVEGVLPAIHNEHFDHGVVTVNHHDLSETDLRAILQATKDAEDGQYVTVDSKDEKVRIQKKGEQLLILVHDMEDPDHPEDVEIRMPVKVLAALLTDNKNELNVLAAIRVLGEAGPQELVTVHSDEEDVRIWVDKQKPEDDDSGGKM